MTLENILQAAAQIFQEKGYHATSMQDIANAVDLQKGSLYHYVDSKQDILYALLDQALSLILERLQAVVSEELAPQEKIRQAMRSYFSFLAENPSLSSVLLLEYRSLEPIYKQKHIPLRDQVDHIWQEILEEGNMKGEFNAPETGLISKALLGVLNWTITWYREDGPLTAEQIADQFTDLFFTGILARDNEI
ncbi:MAG: TetR/AcrR family transcriptional regulator [Anaerolineales bacterium]